jgi:hypothetical protein
MDIGPLGSYRLPLAIRNAYGIDTAQQLADSLGVTKRPSLALSGEAEAAYNSLKNGDRGPARALLVEQLGVSEQAADSALSKFPRG